MSSLHFTIIQTSLFWEDKGANLDKLGQKIRSIQEPTEIIVLPEMFNTGFSMQPTIMGENMEGPTVDWMRRLSAEKKAIITGSLIIEENGKSVSAFDSKGKLAPGVYMITATSQKDILSKKLIVR